MHKPPAIRPVNERLDMFLALIDEARMKPLKQLKARRELRAALVGAALTLDTFDAEARAH